jgi:hypothetical protein
MMMMMKYDLMIHGSENWIINKRDAQKPEAAQMRFLRTVSGLNKIGSPEKP